MGVVGTGFLTIPVLGGALSYMVAEAYDRQQGLDKWYSEAPAFYATLALSLVVGLAIDFLPISPVQALVWTAVLYGITAPVLIGVIMYICNDQRVMGDHTNGRRQNAWSLITLTFMVMAAFMLIRGAWV